ncbi:YeiH family protein [Methylobrevis pamukkalensis]|uniref:Sulfate exporter family transporter n=1 Tax=Methylobrevis pamukkalensis TaxID=1439726 RepID=A0A1E3H6Q4_9HYPH|nr:putative sulfate exporter family transporter [Methylobrevis pamukkalensis]ODN72002.1 hypothetical protein A6302_00627 [Methylobrevis pamukkalensis]
MSLTTCLASLGPGLALAALVSVVALGLERAEIAATGGAWIDGLVFAILLGALLRSLAGPRPAFEPGIRLAAKGLLEVVIVLLGASIGFGALAGAGVRMITVVAGVVVAAIAISYGIGRLLGLSDRLATLVACGNSICGNSAIVAAAPAIEAEADEVASAIAFTAALGILVVLLLPLAVPLLGLGEWQYGVMAGLTVYAVPQVLAATLPVGALATQVGTLVKLMRVLMLGPVVILLGLRAGGRSKARPTLAELVPWFILGFLAMMAARSLGLLPEALLEPIARLAGLLTVVSMAGLGLSVDLRAVVASGGRVLIAGVLSLAVLTALALLALQVLPAGAV